MSEKIAIYNNSVAERNYCRKVAQFVEPSLTDADFFGIGSPQASNWDAIANDYKSRFSDYAIKPILVLPTSWDYETLTPSVNQASRFFVDYPDIPIVTSFYKSGALPSLPAVLTMVPNRLNPAVLVSGGVDGLSDYYTGVGLEFVEPAHLMYYVDENTNVESFVISNVTNVAGVARIYSAQLVNYALQNNLVHLDGIAGFANNINGKQAIASVNSGSGYVTVNFDLGAGTFSGPATAKIQFVSGAIAAVAAKLSRIMTDRQCSFWEARYCARLTATEEGLHTNATGYGEIDVDAAIAVDSGIPQDPFDTIPATSTISLAVVEKSAEITVPEIVNAKRLDLYVNGVLESSTTTPYLLHGLTYKFTIYPIMLGLIEYYIKAVRGEFSTDKTNTVNTNITELTGLPEAPIYEVGFLTYYWNGADLNSSEVVSVNQLVSNPENNNVGIVETIYVLEDGAAIPETRLYASANDALAGLVPGFYLNAVVPLSVDAFVPAGDLAGQDFRGTDFTVVGDYDFTGGIVANTNFDGAILPTAYDDLEGLELFLSQVAYCNVKTTIWVNGLTVEEELEA